MIALALSWELTAAWVCAVFAAMIGVWINVPMAVEVAQDPTRSARDRAVEVGSMMMILPALWATVGVVISPAVALAAAWVSWSF